jgi:hypothetical protein
VFTDQVRMFGQCPHSGKTTASPCRNCMVSPQVKRQAVDVLEEERGLGVTRPVGWWVSLDRYITIAADELTVVGCGLESASWRARNVGMDIDGSTYC